LRRNTIDKFIAESFLIRSAAVLEPLHWSGVAPQPQCPGKATKNSGHVGLSHVGAEKVAPQVFDMSHNGMKWY
jgi:hypothetical protein